MHTASGLGKMNKQQLLYVAESFGFDTSVTEGQTKKELVELILSSSGNQEYIEQDSTNVSELSVNTLDKIAKTESSEEDNTGLPIESMVSEPVKSEDDSMKNRKQDSGVLITLPGFQDKEPYLTSLLNRVLFSSKGYKAHAFAHRYKGKEFIPTEAEVKFINQTIKGLRFVASKKMGGDSFQFIVLAHTYSFLVNCNLNTYKNLMLNLLATHEKYLRDLDLEWFESVYSDLQNL
jgi:hypothetical protein